MIFLNWKGPQGRETVDEINVSEFASRRAAMRYAATLQREYAIAGMFVYTSTRKCGNWK